MAEKKSGRTEKTMVYSSPSIHARRQRILDETRKLIADRGLAGFSMIDLAKRAEVAERTVYNLFQTRERLIAAAIYEYFEDYISRIPYVNPIGTLQRNIERLTSVARRNMKIRQYTKAIMAVYFAADIDSDVWGTIHDMAVQPIMQWLQKLRGRRQLQPWIDEKNLADDIVRYEYALISDWANARIPDEEFIHRIVTGVLTLMAGATKGMARREIEEMLVNIQENGIPDANKLRDSLTTSI